MIVCKRPLWQLYTGDRERVLIEYIKNRILTLYEELQPLSVGKAVEKIAPKLLREMPLSGYEFIAVCDGLMGHGDRLLFRTVTALIKLRKNLYHRLFIEYYQRWLFTFANDIGACDMLCGRVLNPMMEKFTQLQSTGVLWALSDKVLVRRAAAVSLIGMTRPCKVSVSFARVKEICNILRDDPHPHVQKAVGWLLRYACLRYPRQAEAYLKDNKPFFSPTAFRYALQKMSKEKKDYFMGL